MLDEAEEPVVVWHDDGVLRLLARWLLESPLFGQALLAGRALEIPGFWHTRDEIQRGFTRRGFEWRMNTGHPAFTISGSDCYDREVPPDLELDDWGVDTMEVVRADNPDLPRCLVPLLVWEEHGSESIAQELELLMVPVTEVG